MPKSASRAVTKSKVKAPSTKPQTAKTSLPVKSFAATPVKQAIPPMQAPARLSMIQKPMMRQGTSPVAVKKPGVTAKTTDFRVGNYVVYPTHGVGKILAEETQNIGDVSLKVFVIGFEKDKMTLRVPVTRALAAGLRNISDNSQMERAFITLKGRARPSKGMWSRRAQEYEAKINSGNLISVAEVVRDLYKNVDQAERSYSERMIYESAFNRLVGELAAAEKIDSKSATERLVKILRQQVQATVAAA